ncbi:MAG: MbnP family protein [Ferruginibacter sp.]
MNKWLFFIGCWFGLPLAQAQTRDNGRIEIIFLHMVDENPLVLHDSVYWNPHKEPYSIKKLKYYLTDFYLDDTPLQIGNDPYVLIDASNEYNIIQASVPAGTYHTLRFKLGVDSIDNCSGAQTGALDPANDMFWTWNSGYIFFKLEGTSDSSQADLNRIEYHLGGYKSEQAIQSTIELGDQHENIQISNRPHQKTRMLIRMDLQKFWGNNAADLKISERPLSMKPGIRADYFRRQFRQLFSMKKHYQVP